MLHATEVLGGEAYDVQGNFVGRDARSFLSSRPISPTGWRVSCLDAANTCRFWRGTIRSPRWRRG